MSNLVAALAQIQTAALASSNDGAGMQRAAVPLEVQEP